MKLKNLEFECRLCCSTRTESIIDLDGFPKSAQYFISSLEDTEEDQPITLMVCQCIDCGLIQLKNDPVSYYKDVITAASLSKTSKKELINEMGSCKSADITAKNLPLAAINPVLIAAKEPKFLACTNI